MTILELLTADPYEFLAEQRRQGPVTYIDALGGWVVTGYEAAVDVMRRSDVFTVDDPRFTTAQVIGESMLSLDGAAHVRHREPFVPPYRPVAIERSAADWVQNRASSLVSSLPAKGAELRSGLAARLAAETVLMTLALAADPREALGWYRDIVETVDVLSSGGERPRSGPAAFQSLLAAVAATPDHDSEVLATARQTLEEREVAANVAVVMFGAIETTEGAIANLCWHLLTHAALGAVRADRELIPAAIEESLRLEPSASRVDRYVTEPSTIAGVAVQPGDLVIVSLLAANRDPAVFDDPDRFRLDRRNAGKHLTFARGPHACLGAHLARLEMAAAVKAFIDQFPEARLDRERSVGPRGLVFRKAQQVVLR